MDITLFPSQGNIFLKKINSKTGLTEDKLDGYLIDSDEKEIRRIIDILKAKKQKKIIAIQGRDDAFNRRIIETCKVDYLVSPESEPKKDSLKQRDSGINHVVAKEAKKKNIPIVINFSELNKLDKKSKSKKISRIIQNLKICRKNQCKIKIASFAETKEQIADEYSLKSFLFSLGASSQQVGEATQFSN